MKKQYISPLATEVNVETSTMLAASAAIYGGRTVDTSEDATQLSGGRRGSWGNLWN